jgi:hypothetical protein
MTQANNESSDTSSFASNAQVVPPPPMHSFKPKNAEAVPSPLRNAATLQKPSVERALPEPKK